MNQRYWDMTHTQRYWMSRKHGPRREIVDEELAVPTGSTDDLKELFEVFECGHAALGRYNEYDGLPTHKRRSCKDCLQELRIGTRKTVNLSSTEKRNPPTFEEIEKRITDGNI